MKREIPANFYLDPTKNEHLGTSLFCPEASVHQPNQVLTRPPLPLSWTGLSGGCASTEITDSISQTSNV